MTILATLDQGCLESIVSRIERQGKVARLYVEKGVLEIMCYDYSRVTQSLVRIMTSECADISHSFYSFSFKTKLFARAARAVLAECVSGYVYLLFDGDQLFISADDMIEHVPRFALVENSSFSLDEAFTTCSVTLDYDETRQLYEFVTSNRAVFVGLTREGVQVVIPTSTGRLTCFLDGRVACDGDSTERLVRSYDVRAFEDLLTDSVRSRLVLNRSFLYWVVEDCYGTYFVAQMPYYDVTID